jgi:hypothetical protein
MCQALWVLDQQRPAVRQMNVERLKWASQMQTAELLDGHG